MQNGKETQSATAKVKKATIRKSTDDIWVESYLASQAAYADTDTRTRREDATFQMFLFIAQKLCTSRADIKRLGWLQGAYS